MTHNSSGFGRRRDWILGLRPRRLNRRCLRPRLLELEQRRLLTLLTVMNTGNDPNSPGTLPYVIAEANADLTANTIAFAPMFIGSQQTITLQGQLELSNTSGTQAIDGPAGGVTISGGGNGRVLEIDKEVTTSITGFTITGGSQGAPGGGLYNLGTVNLYSCIISGNTTKGNEGGGLWNNGEATLSDCTISGNTASAAQATGTGGGLENRGTMTLAGCTVTKNYADGYYGGGLDNRGMATLTNTTISGNHAGDSGGGVNNHGSGNLTMNGCTLTSNNAKYNGGLYNSGMADLTKCSISSNTGRNDGGVGNNGGALELTDSSVSGNTATFCGGLDEGGGKATLTDCTISDNSSSSGQGGGIAVGGSGRAYLAGCTINGNSSSGNGGGVHCQGDANLANCTISGNSAAKDGGGIYDIGTTTLTACTVSANLAAAGGGLYNKVGTMLIDTIISGNTLLNSTTPSDIDGSVSSSSSYCLVGPGGYGGLKNGTNHIIFASPGNRDLATLGFYGGPTQTMALLPGSAAIGNGVVADYPGTTTPITTDQRGEPLDSPPDIGAFQTHTDLVVNTSSDETGGLSSGELSLRQAVNLANLLDAAAMITFDFAAAQVIVLTQGQLELSDTGGTVTIVGPTSGLTISGGGDSRVFDVDSDVTANISGLTITDGSTSLDGGGLYNKGTATLTDCTISGNSTTNSGGGVGNDGTTALINCTISGNSASDGGGVYSDGTLTVTNSTIAYNNVASDGGGLQVTSSTAILNNTIIALNNIGTGSGATPDDIAGTVSPVSAYNLVGIGGSGGLVNDVAGNQVGVVDPGLGTLTDNGGPTLTIALLPGSAAIDGGSNALAVDASGNPLTTDQRGFPRISGGSVDIGAFEVQKPVVSPTTLPNDTYGTASSQTITATETGSAGGPYTFAITAGALPVGLILATGGVLSGVPSVTGMFSFTVTATDSGGFTGGQPYTIIVNPAPLTVTPSTGQSKFYGSAVPSLTYTTVSGFVNGDTSSLLTGELGTSATMASPVGKYAFTPGTLSAGGNYTLAVVTNPPTFAVTPAPLTVSGITARDKVYDTTTHATLVGLGTATLNGVIGVDSVTLVTAGAVGTFASKDAGNDIPVQISGLSLSGAQASDYSLIRPATTATISPASLTVSGITASDKVYDATTTATLFGLGTATLNGVIGVDSVTLVTAGAVGTFASKDAGNDIPVQISGLSLSGAQASDYSLIQPATTATISPASLTVSGITASDKVYDATTTATLFGLGTATLNGVIGVDSVTLVTAGAVGTFASKDAGNDVPVQISGLSLSGTQASDYSLSPPAATATISPASLTVSGITASDKVYDATTTATLFGLGTATLNGVIGVDSVTLVTAGAIGAFASKDAGNDIAVQISGLSLSGAQARDYSLIPPAATATISAASLTVSGITASDKVYEATTAATLVGLGTATLNGVFVGDSVTLVTAEAVGTFASKDAGNDIAVQISGLSLSGAQASDYSLIPPATTATISAASLTVSGITANDKVYDAATDATLAGLGTATLTGVIAGDSVSLVTTGAIGTFASKDVGNGVSVVVSGLTISGAQAFDYALIPPTTNAKIIARFLTASLTGTVERTYDGTIAADLLPGNFILSGVLPGDSVVLNDPSAAVYDSKNAGTGKTVSVSGLTLTGPDAADYQLSSTSIRGAVGEISTAPLTITANSQTKVYGAAIQTLTASYSGLVNGDTPATFTTLPTLSTTASTFSPVIAGGYAITASGAIDPNYAITYEPGILSVTRAATEVVLITEPVFKKKHKLVSVGLTAEVQPVAPGAGLPTGTATFDVQVKVKKKLVEKKLGTVSLKGGSGTLSVKPNSVSKKPITVIYGGDADFAASTSP